MAASLQTTTTATTLRASGSLAANTTDSTPVLNLEGTTGPLGATVYVASTPGGTVASGAQLLITVSVSVDGGTTWPTVPSLTFSLPSVASTLGSLTFTLPGGSRYRVQLTNTDASNAITTVFAAYGEVNSIG